MRAIFILVLLMGLMGAIRPHQQKGSRTPLAPWEVEEIKNFASKAYSSLEKQPLLDQQTSYSHYVGNRIRAQQQQQQPYMMRPPRIFRFLNPFNLRRPTSTIPSDSGGSASAAIASYSPPYQYQPFRRPGRPQPPPQQFYTLPRPSATPSLQITSSQRPRPQHKPQRPPPPPVRFYAPPTPSFQLAPPHHQHQKHINAIMAHQLNLLEKEKKNSSSTPSPHTTEYSTQEFHGPPWGVPPPPPRPYYFGSPPFMFRLPSILSFHLNGGPPPPPPRIVQWSSPVQGKVQGEKSGNSTTTSTETPLSTGNKGVVEHPKESNKLVQWEQSAHLPQDIALWGRGAGKNRPLPLTPQQQRNVFTAAADSSSITMESIPLVHSHHDDIAVDDIIVSSPPPPSEKKEEDDTKYPSPPTTYVMKVLPGGKRVKMRKVRKHKKTSQA